MKRLNLAVLFSGGKDSNLALHKATELENVVCLITIESINAESYMYHTPNISIAALQAKALGLPIIRKKTLGNKEKELLDLKKAIKLAIKKYRIEGIVTGAVESIYQAERVQKICSELNIWCFNPLWKKDQISLLKELIQKNYEVIISGVFAHPLNESFLGRKLDDKLCSDLINLQNKFKISPSGEGGEIETTVLDSPLYSKKINILKSNKLWEDRSGKFEIQKARLIKK